MKEERLRLMEGWAGGDLRDREQAFASSDRRSRPGGAEDGGGEDDRVPRLTAASSTRGDKGALR